MERLAVDYLSGREVRSASFEGVTDPGETRSFSDSFFVRAETYRSIRSWTASLEEVGPCR